MKRTPYHFNPWVHWTFRSIIATENTTWAIFGSAASSLVYVRWLHEIFVLMKYALDRKPGQKALCPINIKFSGNNNWLHVIDTSPAVNTRHHMHSFLLMTLMNLTEKMSETCRKLKEKNQTQPDFIGLVETQHKLLLIWLVQTFTQFKIKKEIDIKLLHNLQNMVSLCYPDTSVPRPRQSSPSLRCPFFTMSIGYLNMETFLLFSA